MATPAPLRYQSLRVIRDRLDPESRRTTRVEPYAALFLLPEGQSKLREVALTRRELRLLIRDASAALVSLEEARP